MADTDRDQSATAPIRLTPYLAVSDTRAALEWYADAFGARAVGEPIGMPDGRVGHAELDFGGAPVYLSDAHPEIQVVAPSEAGTPVTLHAEVADVDRLVERAVAAGATLDRPPAETPHGRIAVLRDPFGHRWMLATHTEDMSEAEMQRRMEEVMSAT